MTDSTFKKLYQEYQASGLSVRDFCTNQDIGVSTFYHRKKRLEKQNETPNEFVPLLIESPESHNRKYQNKVPAICEDSTSNDPLLEFVFPNGTKLLLKGNTDITLLKTIVHLY